MLSMLQPAELLRARLVERQRYRSKLDPPEILVHFLEPDRLANQGFTQEQPTALPLDLSIGADSADFIAARVLHLREPAREHARRGRVAGRRVRSNGEIKWQGWEVLLRGVRAWFVGCQHAVEGLLEIRVGLSASQHH